MIQIEEKKIYNAVDIKSDKSDIEKTEHSERDMQVNTNNITIIKTSGCCSKMTTKRIIILISIISLTFSIIIITVLATKIQHALTPLFEWFNPIKWNVLPLIMLFYALWIILTIPAEETFAILIGFFYGFLIGWPIVFITSTFACCTAFILSRYVIKKYIFTIMCKCCRKRDNNEIEDFDRWFAFLVENHDFLAVLAIRFFFIPPASWTNHLFAHTKCKFISFALATGFGKIFQSLISAYIGSQLKNIFQVTSSPVDDPVVTYVLPAGFFVAFLVVAFIIGYKSRKWVKEQKEIYEQNDEHKYASDEDLVDDESVSITKDL